MPFKFRGPIAASKSILNRALTIQSFEPGISIQGDSTCDDVVLMKKAFALKTEGGREFDCGHAGTVFRFLALRLARETGDWVLRGSERLLSRPHGGLLNVLIQLGVGFDLKADSLVLRTRGWKPRQEIIVEGAESSQFLTSLILSAWRLESPLAVTLKGGLVSRGYFDLTEQMTKYFGMRLHSTTNGGWLVPANQVPQAKEFSAEPDMSSCFAVAACAVLGGKATIEKFPLESSQPDAVFRELLSMMKVSWSQDDDELSVEQTHELHPISVDVNNNPDVVPVLAVLLARASGSSTLRGFGHLVHKESNRLEQVQNLLTRLGRRFEVVGGEMVIHGKSEPFSCDGDFDPDQDHRMAMAAQVANFGGARFRVLHPEVVDKSFPEFWKIVGPA